jgi:hypothetical protein
VQPPAFNRAAGERLLLGGEIDVHRLQNTEKNTERQEKARAAAPRAVQTTSFNWPEVSLQRRRVDQPQPLDFGGINLRPCPRRSRVHFDIPITDIMST